MGYTPFPLTGGSSTSNPQIVTIQSDNSLLPTDVILNETNYALWSQVMEMRIVARENLGYLTSAILKPSEFSPTYNK
ncbi:unnamed protein product [Prunus brigantina]